MEQIINEITDFIDEMRLYNIGTISFDTVFDIIIIIFKFAVAIFIIRAILKLVKRFRKPKQINTVCKQIIDKWIDDNPGASVREVKNEISLKSISDKVDYIVITGCGAVAIKDLYPTYKTNYTGTTNIITDMNRRKYNTDMDAALTLLEKYYKNVSGIYCCGKAEELNTGFRNTVNYPIVNNNELYELLNIVKPE